MADDEGLDRRRDAEVDRMNLGGAKKDHVANIMLLPEPPHRTNRRQTEAATKGDCLTGSIILPGVLLKPGSLANHQQALCQMLSDGLGHESGIMLHPTVIGRVAKHRRLAYLSRMIRHRHNLGSDLQDRGGQDAHLAWTFPKG